MKVSKVDYFNRVVEVRLKSLGEFSFTGDGGGQVRAYFNGTYSLTSIIDSDTFNSKQKVRLVFTERALWSEFPDSCVSKFECQITEGNFNFRPSYELAEYADLFAKDIVSTINLFTENDPSPPCRCVNPVESTDEFPIQVKSEDGMIGALLKIQSVEVDEGVKLGLSILMGTVLGQSKQIPGWTRDLFKETGLYHLLVISGFHLGVLIYLLKLISQLLLSALPSVYKIIPIIKLQTILSTFLILLFVFNIDSGLPIWRALITFLILLFLLLIDRSISRGRLILLSLIAIEVLWPLSIALASVQLTFAALSGIFFGLYLIDLRERNNDESLFKVQEKKENIFSTVNFIKFITPNLFAFIFISPIQYYWFGSFSIFTLLFNVIFSSVFSLSVIGFGFISLFALYLNLPIYLILIRANALITYYIVCFISFLHGFL